jgi:hypothetical protein
MNTEILKTKTEVDIVGIRYEPKTVRKRSGADMRWNQKEPLNHAKKKKIKNASE